MRNPKELWRGLEALPGLAGVLAEWREVWGQSEPIGRKFLRPTSQRATSYPCPSPGGDGCPRGLIFHTDDDIVAVCRQSPKHCDSIKLGRADVVIYELDWKAFCFAIAAPLEITQLRRPTCVLPQTFRIGYQPLASGQRAPVYLTIQHDGASFRESVCRLLAKEDTRFVLIAPTADLCDADSHELLNDRGAVLLALADALSVDNTGALAATAAGRALLSAFANARPLQPPGRLSATSVSVSRARLQSPEFIEPVSVPRGARWDDLHLVMDDLQFKFKLLGRHDTLDFKRAGFADRRKRDYPNYLWNLLQQFARAGGKLQHCTKYQISKLRESLHRIFPISRNPIVLEGKDSYRALFNIRSKDGITIPVPEGTTYSNICVVETRTGNIRFIIDAKRRFMAYESGFPTETSEKPHKEAAEGPDTRVEEYELLVLGLSEEDGQPNQIGQALLEVLRGGGRVKRSEYDKGMEGLCGFFSRTFEIGGSAFDFSEKQKEWISRFEALSERAAR